MKGYDLATVRASVDQSIRGGSSMSLGNNKLPPFSLIQGVERDSSGPGKSSTVAKLLGGGGGMVKMISEHSAIFGNSNNPGKATDFEAIIEDLDRELADSTPTSNMLVAEFIRDIKGKEADKVNPEFMHGSVEMLGESVIVGSEKVSASMQAELGNVGFSLGWAEVSEKKKNVKTGHSKHASKGSNSKGKTDGADLTKEHKKGTWTRLPFRPNNE